jgi:hypothetical protein
MNGRTVAELRTDGAFGRVLHPLGCKASLVSLARTRDANGERRGEGAPAFRVWSATQAGPERDAQGRVSNTVSKQLGSM